MEFHDPMLYIIAIGGWELIRIYNRSKSYENAYASERKGRLRVEQEMKRLSTIQLHTNEGFFVQSIGTILSCYKQCVGTPRQGLLVPHSRAVLLLSNNISPDALDGVEEFSHVWLTFQFHLNTNTLKEAKAFDKSKYTFSAKVTPPMLKQKKGVFATRSPHRPNAVGITLARIEAVYKTERMLLLSACDLVHSTPILDIKPYVPIYDSIPDGLYHIPLWISETIYTRNTVITLPETRLQARQLVSKMSLYRSDVIHPISKNKRKELKRKYISEEIYFLEDLFWKGLIETLEADVRSEFQTKKVIETDGLNFGELPFDGVLVKTRWIDARTIEIYEITVMPDILNNVKENEYINEKVEDIE